jgi:glutaredoxin-related protein
MLQKLTNTLQVQIYQALFSERGNQWKPVRLVREVLATANDLCGRPFCSAQELAERRGVTGTKDSDRREAAPVMLYFDGKDQRTQKKMTEVLRAREIPFQVLDVSDDEATRSWALTQAKAAEFPLLFIAGEPIGGLHELTQLDVNGQLKQRVFAQN